MTPKKKTTISLLHATRRRAEEASTTRDRWLQAAEYPERVEHIFAFDRDDNESVAELTGFRYVVVQERDKGCVAAWNLAARSSKGEILVQLSDDWLPIRHWDSRIYARFRSSSAPGVLRVSDGRRVDDLLAFAVFNRAYLDVLNGDFLSPEYFGVYSDDEFSFRAYQNGVVIDARDIVFEHCHPSFSAEAVYDETHRRQNDDARYREGREIFLRRNPSARGHWLHEGTEERFYLPPGHRFVQNFIGPVHLARSPLGRSLPAQGGSSEQASLQLGQREGRTNVRGIIRKLSTFAKRLVSEARIPGRVAEARSTLWSGEEMAGMRSVLPGVNLGSIPVFVISYNQPTYLRNMVTQLLRLEVPAADIHIIDNASSHPAVTGYLRALETQGINVTRLERNFGPHEIFAPEAGVHWPEVFALTDPDLEFNPHMPATFRDDLCRIASACGVWKCGLALSLDDAEFFRPDPYVCGQSIAEWEKRFWRLNATVGEREIDLLRRAGAEVYHAEVDTTFAVYLRDHPRTSFLQAVRVSGLYCARHLPWYRDGHSLPKHLHTDSEELPAPDEAEAQFYAETALQHATLRSVKTS
jgi:hypothetical protein